jgi:hypothetical protein
LILFLPLGWAVYWSLLIPVQYCSNARSGVFSKDLAQVKWTAWRVIGLLSLWAHKDGIESSIIPVVFFLVDQLCDHPDTLSTQHRLGPLQIDGLRILLSSSYSMNEYFRARARHNASPTKFLPTLHEALPGT